MQVCSVLFMCLERRALAGFWQQQKTWILQCFCTRTYLYQCINNLSGYILVIDSCCV